MKHSIDVDWRGLEGLAASEKRISSTRYAIMKNCEKTFTRRYYACCTRRGTLVSPYVPLEKLGIVKVNGIVLRRGSVKEREGAERESRKDINVRAREKHGKYIREYPLASLFRRACAHMWEINLAALSTHASRAIVRDICASYVTRIRQPYS